MRLRQPGEAARQYEAILATHPDLTQVRLERAVEGFLNAIDARKRWSAHVSLAALPETNAVRRTDRETVQIGGARFRLNEDAREASGVGARVSNRIHVSASTNVDRRTHDERDELDGWRASVNPAAVRNVLGSQTLLEVGPHFEAIEAEADHRASRLAGIGVGVSRAFENGITASLSASFQQRRYRADDPLFDVKRRDRVAWLSARVLHRSLQLGGFAPYVGYSYERSRSNIPLHEYKNHGAILGFTREF